LLLRDQPLLYVDQTNVYLLEVKRTKDDHTHEKASFGFLDHIENGQMVSILGWNLVKNLLV